MRKFLAVAFLSLVLARGVAALTVLDVPTQRSSQSFVIAKAFPRTPFSS